MSNKKGKKGTSQVPSETPAKPTGPTRRPVQGESIAAWLKRSNRHVGDLTGKELANFKSKWTTKSGGFFSIEDFEIGRPLGSGHFGKVYVARDKVNDLRIVALKVLFKRQLAAEQAQILVEREIEIHLHLRHPNVIKLYTYFWDEEKVYLVLEYAVGGELFKELQLCEKFDEETSAVYIHQIAEGLTYCHEKNVIHRDIKPENLLIGAIGELKICDFGWSVHAGKNKQRKTYCGTRDYLAPEMLTGEAHNAAVDLWCIGVLCYEFLVGQPPFEGETDEQIHDNIKMVRFKFPRYVSKSARNLISGLLQRNPQDRISLNQVINHPWVREHSAARKMKGAEEDG